MSPYLRFAALAIVVPLAVGCSSEPTATPELAAHWWQWTKSAPAPVNPVRDLSGEHCAVGQTGSVWFLAGGYGSSKIRRRCTVPADQALFFPVINMVHYPHPNGAEYTCDRAKTDAAVNNDTALELFAELDGVSIEIGEQQRIRSEDCFDIFERVSPRPDGLRGYPSATDGFWLLLQPLEPGTHSLKFGGRYNAESGSFGKMIQDIEYQLIVN